MDKPRTTDSDKEAFSLSCHYVAKQKAPLSRISGPCEVNVNTLQLGMLVEANEVHLDGGVRIRVHDDDNADVWRKTEWRCHKFDLAPVSTLVWHFLAAVTIPQERVRIATDPQLCRDVSKILVKDKVWYQPRRTDARRCLAVIKHIGPMSDRGQAFYFGLELPDGQSHAQTFATKNSTGPFANMTIATLDEICPIDHEFSYKVKNNDTKKTSTVENVCLPNDFDGLLMTGGSLNNHTANGSSVPRELRLGFEARSSSFGDTNNNNNNNGNSNGDLIAPLTNPLIPKVARLGKSKIVTNDTSLNPQSLINSELIDYLLDKRSCEHNEHLSNGTAVQVRLGSETRYGVLRWIGTLQGVASGSTAAAVELEDGDHELGTDGTYAGERYFHCRPHRAVFTDIKNCQEFNIISSDDHSHKPNGDDFGMAENSVVTGIVRPLAVKGDLESICGKYRGIQGHHNSCYLDATLFSMFAFTSVFDNLLFRPPNEKDCLQYEEVQRVLREEIVNPLRKNMFVRANRVMKLRMLLEKLSSVSGLTSEEKDPEEFLTSLVAQILNAEPFLKLSSGQDAFHYQLFVEKDDHLTFPTVQQLLEQSFLTSNIRLKEVPSCLIIQMPRFGKSFKMYQKIQPTLLLDVTDIIEDSPRQCTVCGKLAEFECKECYEQCGIGLESIAFCMNCLEKDHRHIDMDCRCHMKKCNRQRSREDDDLLPDLSTSLPVHRHERRTNHEPRALEVPPEFLILLEHCPVPPRLFLELSAVVCIETSHYVSFVKCGSGSEAPWCFFDSMADRKGEQNGYNIPEMVPCPDFPYWLSEEGAKSLTELTDDRQLPEHAKRLLCDAYMCMYQSPDVMMYK